MLRKSMDNVTVVMISLSGFSRACFPVPEQEPATAKRPANSRQLLKRAESFSGKPATPKMMTHAPRTTLKTPEKPNSTQPAKTGDELLPTRTLSLSNSISTIMKPSSPGKIVVLPSLIVSKAKEKQPPSHRQDMQISLKSRYQE